MGSINDLAGVLLGLDPSLEYDEEWWAETSGLNLDEDYWVSLGIAGQLVNSLQITNNTIENVSLGTIIVIGAGTVTGNSYDIVPFPLVNFFSKIIFFNSFISCGE